MSFADFASSDSATLCDSRVCLCLDNNPNASVHLLVVPSVRSSFPRVQSSYAVCGCKIRQNQPHVCKTMSGLPRGTILMPVHFPLCSGVDNHSRVHERHNFLSTHIDLDIKRGGGILKKPSRMSVHFSYAEANNPLQVWVNQLEGIGRAKSSLPFHIFFNFDNATARALLTVPARYFEHLR